MRSNHSSFFFFEQNQNGLQTEPLELCWFVGLGLEIELAPECWSWGLGDGEPTDKGEIESLPELYPLSDTGGDTDICGLTAVVSWCNLVVKWDISELPKGCKVWPIGVVGGTEVKNLDTSETQAVYPAL